MTRNSRMKKSESVVSPCTKRSDRTENPPPTQREKKGRSEKVVRSATGEAGLGGCRAMRDETTVVVFAR